MKTISHSDVPDEDALVQVLVQMGEFNHTFTKKHLRDKKKETWVTLKKPSNMHQSWTTVSHGDIWVYHANANLTQELEGIPPSNLFNCDKSCLQNDPSDHKCIFPKGVRHQKQAGVYNTVVLYVKVKFISFFLFFSMSRSRDHNQVLCIMVP